MLDKKRNYDKVDRIRNFQGNWTGKYTWLELSEDGTMFCRPCKKYEIIYQLMTRKFLCVRNRLIQTQLLTLGYLVKKRQPACCRKKCNQAVSENQAISSIALTSANSEFLSTDNELSEDDDEEYYLDTEEVVEKLCLREVEGYKKLEVFNSELEYDI